MQLQVLDGEGNTQTVIVAGIESIVDESNVIAQTGVSQMAAAANGNRSGWAFQNQSQNGNWMYLNELGTAATSATAPGNGSWAVAPGAVFPPPGFPLSTAQINILGTAGDVFVFREW